MTRSLFFRAEPVPGESIYGYLSRLGRVLGYRSHAWVYDAFPGHFPIESTRSLLTQPDLGFLAEALSLSRESLDTMRLPQSGRHQFVCRGQTIARQDINAATEYFCPICVQGSGTHFLAWHLAFVTACPIHKCHLISRCPDCRRKFDLATVLDGTCDRCSRGIKPETPPEDRAALIVGRLLSMIGGIEGNDKPVDMPDILQGLALSEALDITLSLGRAVEIAPKTGRNSVREIITDRLTRGFSICENWTAAIPEILKREFERPKSVSTSKLGFFQRRFIRNKNSNVRRISLAAADAFEKAKLEGHSNAEGKIDFNEYLKLSIAAELLDISHSMLLHMCSRYDRKFERIKLKRTFYIRKSGVEWIRQSRTECISEKGVAALLNISDRHQIRALYDARIFPHADPTLYFDRRIRSFHKPTVEAFIQHLLDLPEQQNFDPEVEVDWRTAKAMYMARHNSSVSFFKAVTAGHLLPAGRLSGKKGLPSLIFRKNAIQTVLS